MPGYVRPPVVARVFRDAEGRTVDYGHRWGGNAPPEETYSVLTNPERFAPLHTVAEALIAHLVTTYQVEVSDDPANAGDVAQNPGETVLRAVRIVPDERAAAELTVILTSWPSVRLRAGLLHVFPYPECGCDACDEDWQSQATELERHVLAVAAGHYREFVLADTELWIGYSIDVSAADRQSSRSVASSSADRARAAAARASGLPERWAPWPPRVH